MSLTARQPRVAILTSTRDGFGGMEQNAVNLTRTLTQQGYHVRCVFPVSENSDFLLKWCRQQGVEAEASEAFLHYDQPHTLSNVRRLGDTLAAWNLTGVSLHYPESISLKDALAVRLAGVPRCVATIHCVPEESSAWQRKMSRLASQVIDAVVVRSHAVRQGILAVGIPANKVAYIRPGIHAPEETPPPAAARARLGLPPDAFVVGTLARLVPEKGIDCLIEAVRSLPNQADGPYLLIAGDGPERETLSRLAEAQLGARARMLGRLSGADLADFYAALDVFALTPLWQEAFGMVYLEAAQFGVPSVSWRGGGVADVIVDGETGLLVDAQDVNAVGKALARLRANPTLRTQLGTQAWARASSEFSEARMAESYARLLRLGPGVPRPQEERSLAQYQLR